MTLKRRLFNEGYDFECFSLLTPSRRNIVYSKLTIFKEINCLKEILSIFVFGMEENRLFSQQPQEIIRQWCDIEDLIWEGTKESLENAKLKIFQNPDFFLLPSVYCTDKAMKYRILNKQNFESFWSFIQEKAVINKTLIFCAK